MAKRALVLVRVSSDLQKDNYSPESQESGCREYARENGLEVTQVITEVCSGALEFDQRPGLAQFAALQPQLEGSKAQNSRL